jgi:hypothetical protein
MADAADPIQYFSRWRRRQYLTRYEQGRRAIAKAEGARRIDVTLDAKALDDYATVRSYLKGLNRFSSERKAARLAGPSFRHRDHPPGAGSRRLVHTRRRG